MRLKKLLLPAGIILFLALLAFVAAKNGVSVSYFGAPLVPKSVNQEISQATTTATVIKNIIYTENGFNPTVTRIKPGDSVIFKNESGKSFTLFSEATSSVFIAKGKEYEAKYAEVGTLSFSAKENPSVIGIIIVQ